MVAKDLEEEAIGALERATEAVSGLHATERLLLSGPVPATLQAAIADERATLVVLGTHGHGRGSGSYSRGPRRRSSTTRRARC